MNEFEKLREYLKIAKESGLHDEPIVFIACIEAATKENIACGTSECKNEYNSLNIISKE